MSVKKYIFFLGILLCSLSCSKESDDIEGTLDIVAVEMFDIAYGTDEQQTFDLYLPQDRSETSTKVIVLVHGGGWTSGDKDDLKEVYEYLKANNKNYAIANFNYTLADLNTPPIPLQTNDIQTFLTYFKSNAEAYKIQPEFAFIGTSAGAHLSMLYGYKYDIDRDIKVICNIVGPTDFLHDSYVATTEPETAELISNVQIIYGLSINDNGDFYESVSPINWISELSPPTISFYGGQDFLVPEEQGIILKETLDSKNVVNEYIFYENEGHGWGNPELLDTLTKIETFLSAEF